MQTVGAIRSELEHGQGLSAEGIFRGYVYDGLWTLGLAIESVAEQHMQQHGSIWNPNSGESSNWTQQSAALLQAISRTSFIGVTVSRFLCCKANFHMP